MCDVPGINMVCDAVGEAATAGAGAVMGPVGDWIAASLGDLAGSAAELAATAVDSTTTVNLEAQWFRDHYALLVPIALTALVGAFCLNLVVAAWRADGVALRRALTGTIHGSLFAFVVVPVTMIALTVTDALSAGLFEAAGTSLPDAVRRLVDVALLASLGGLGWALAALVALAMAIGAFLFWGVMILRKVGLLILLALAPFAGAGAGFEFGRRMRRGWIELTATLIVSKAVMTVVFVVGVAALGEASPADTGDMAALSDAIAGLVVMLLVLLSPVAVYRFVRWAGDGAGEEAHRTGSSGIGIGAQRLRQTAVLAAGAGVGAGKAAPQGPTSASFSEGLVPSSSSTSASAGQGVASGSTPSPTPPAANPQAPTGGQAHRQAPSQPVPPPSWTPAPADLRKPPSSRPPAAPPEGGR
ncbi:SCO6881 family protein [Streptomyces triticirhizae]